jgi:RNA polymerase sigma factor (TIGR02999 family)
LASPEEIVKLLEDLSAGKEEAGEKLLPLVYEELRALARYYMSNERSGHTLQTTALVHEAYLRLAGSKETAWESKVHYFRVAARAMRRVLIDHARRKRARGAPVYKPEELIEDPALTAADVSKDLLALDKALDRLSEVDPKLVQVVELRFFGGMTVEQTAKVSGMSPRTVKRDWRLARVWLKEEISRG